MHSVFRLPVADERPSPSVSLSSELRADVALRALLLEQLDVIERAACELRAGNGDPECLHELRVALRRSRALVDTCKGVFPERERERIKRDLKRASALTGPVRDLDVLLAELRAYEKLLPSPSRPYLLRLRRALEGDRAPAWRLVNAGIVSDAWFAWIGRSRSFLESPVPGRSRLPHAFRPVSAVATARIDDAVAKLLKRGRRIDDATPASALHRLRLKTKRLRYLLEAFRSLYDVAIVTELVGTLKAFQDYLGRHQDLEVHARAIAAHAGRLERSGRVTPMLARAVRELADALMAERRAVRVLYAERFAALDTPAHLAAFSALAGAELRAAP